MIFTNIVSFDFVQRYNIYIIKIMYIPISLQDPAASINLGGSWNFANDRRKH